jgi:hypothetical protein
LTGVDHKSGCISLCPGDKNDNRKNRDREKKLCD